MTKASRPLRKVSDPSWLLQNAYYLAHVANAACRDTPEDYPQWEEFQFVNHLAFRGSDDVPDGVHNIDFVPWRDYDGNGYIHSGFAAAFDSVRARVNDFLGMLAQDDLPLWITGHSQGEALAVLAARLLRAYNVTMTITFGQPRVVDCDYPAVYPVLPRPHRFANAQDIVPHLPHRGFITGYKDVGELHCFDDNGHITSPWRRRGNPRASARGL